MIDVATIDVNTKDIRGLELAAKAVGGVTKKQLTPAVRKAMKPVLQAARDAAPVDTGALKKGIILKGEKNRAPLKKVFQVTFDRKKNAVFVKGLDENGEGKRAYYPASQEYGFLKRGGGKVPGKHFLRKAAEQEEDKLPDAIAEGLSNEIKKTWEKQHG